MKGSVRGRLRSIEVGTGKWSSFGRPEGFGNLESKELEDFDAPDRTELVAWSDSAKTMDCLAEEGSNVHKVSG